MILRMCPKLLKNLRNLEVLMSHLDEKQCEELFLLLKAIG